MCCQKEFASGVSFKCPECGKETIARCTKCKRLNINYKCKCGFEGP